MTLACPLGVLVTRLPERAALHVSSLFAEAAEFVVPHCDKRVKSRRFASSPRRFCRFLQGTKSRALPAELAEVHTQQSEIWRVVTAGILDLAVAKKIVIAR